MKKITDTERIDWLLKNGIAWRGCFSYLWRRGEWLYDFQKGRKTIDDAIIEDRAASAESQPAIIQQAAIQNGLCEHGKPWGNFCKECGRGDGLLINSRFV